MEAANIWSCGHHLQQFPWPPTGGIAPLVGFMALLSLSPVVTTVYVPETRRPGLDAARDAVPCGHGG